MKERPKLVKQTTLDPTWIRDTMSLAHKYKADIVINKNGDIVGVISGGTSASVRFPQNKEWADAILAIHPDGARLVAAHGISHANAYKAYGNMAIKEGAVAYIDGTTGVVHLESDFVKLKSVVVSIFSSIDIPADDDLERHPLVLKDLIPKPVFDVSSKLAAMAYTDRWSRINASVTSDGNTALLCSNGSCMLAYAVDLPTEYFSIKPGAFSINDVTAYSYALREQEDVPGVPDAIVQFFIMSDGCTYIEVANIPHDRVETIPDMYLSYPDGYDEFLDSDMLELVIESFGAFAGGFSGMGKQSALFEQGKVTAMAGVDPMAEFDMPVALDGKLSLDIELLKLANSLGVSLHIDPACNSNAVMHCSDKLNLAIAKRLIAR